MKILAIDPLQEPGYDDLVMRHSRASIYHHSLWKRLIEQTFKHVQPHYLATFDHQGAIDGIIPGFISENLFSRHSFISLPMATYCDPLFKSEDVMVETFNALLNEQQEHKFTSIELHSLNDYRSLQKLKFQSFKQYVTHILLLNKDAEKLKNSFHKTTIRQRISRAQRLKLELEIANSIEQMDIFYHLHTLNRRRNGLPPLPKLFFRNMWQILYPAGFLSLFLVNYQGRYISAMILLKFKQCIHAEYLATNPDFLQACPNQFLYWEAIKMASQEGFSCFDFGRSSVGNYGLIDFKKRWAAREKQLYYYYFPKGRFISAERRDSLKFKVVNSIFRVLPPGLLQLGGNVYYQYLE